jgi:hypothetical protein
MLRTTAYYKAFFSYWKILLLEIQKKQLVHENHENISGDAGAVNRYPTGDFPYQCNIRFISYLSWTVRNMTQI